MTHIEYRPADQQPKLTGKRPETKEIDNVRKILLGTLMELNIIKCLSFLDKEIVNFLLFQKYVY